jgi:hypothetical protein
MICSASVTITKSAMKSPGVSPERVPVRLLPRLVRRRDDGGPIRGGLLPHGRQVQWGELSGCDYGRAHSFVVTPEPARGVELCGLGEDGSSGARDRLRHPRLRRAGHARPHRVGLTGTSWTYPAAEEIAASGLARLNTHLRIKITTWGVLSPRVRHPAHEGRQRQPS